MRLSSGHGAQPCLISRSMICSILCEALKFCLAKQLVNSVTKMFLVGAVAIGWQHARCLIVKAWGVCRTGVSRRCAKVLAWSTRWRRPLCYRVGGRSWRGVSGRWPHL